VERSAALSEELGLGFPLLADDDHATIRAYGVEDGQNGVAWPSIYVVARDGTVAWRSHAETYKVREAPVAILAALDALP